jgi:hypothetical protein
MGRDIKVRRANKLSKKEQKRKRKEFVERLFYGIIKPAN